MRLAIHMGIEGNSMAVVDRVEESRPLEKRQAQ